MFGGVTALCRKIRFRKELYDAKRNFLSQEEILCYRKKVSVMERKFVSELKLLVRTRNFLAQEKLSFNARNFLSHKETSGHKNTLPVTVKNFLS